MSEPVSQPLVILNKPLPPYIAEQFEGLCEFVPWSLLDSGSAEQLAAITGMVVYGHTPVNDSVLDKLPNVKVISNFGVGYDHIDVASATRHGVVVGNTPGAVDGATADMTMALLLGLARRVADGDRYAHGPDFLHFDPSYMIGKEVYGSTLGILGLGRIGKQVAQRAKGFDMKILYHKRTRDEAAEQALGDYTRGYNAGRYSLLELTQAQETLLQARLEALDAAGDHHENRIQIDRLVGTDLVSGVQP